MENLWVISLGGSKIIPDEVDENFLKEFRELVFNHPGKKFVVVTGGGATARKYIHSMKKLGRGTKTQSMAGIDITRYHAGFLARFFGKKANDEIPMNMKKVKNLLRGNQVVFCGALRYKDRMTTDATSAKLAAFLDAPFVNITNVKGLYSANPKTHKGAKFISQIGWKEFYKIANRKKFTAGQHFVLDQVASKVIMDYKVPTYIVGSLASFEKILKEKKNFGGTLVSG